MTGSAIARQFDSPMLSRIATAKAAEHASKPALEYVARLKTSRAAGPALAQPGSGNLGAPSTVAPGEVLRIAVAYAE